MDKKIVGLLGGAAALATVASAQGASAQTTELPPASSYRHLLDPVSNSMPTLKVDDARQLTEKRGVEGTEVAQVSLQVGHHHHHH